MAWEDPGTSALIVDVPAAIPVVERFRRELTPSGRDGMPPHITLLAPFTPAPLLTASRLREVGHVLAPFASFRFMLTSLARFDEGTLYLTPQRPSRSSRCTRHSWRLSPSIARPGGGRWCRT